MYTNIYQIKKDKFNPNKGTYISSVRQNNNYQEKLISSNDFNKNSSINLKQNQNQPIKRQYINYESINTSSKELKNYNSNSNIIKKSFIIEDKNKETALKPNNNLLQYNYINSNINNQYKSKNNYDSITPKNYTFDSDSNIVNYKDKNELYFSNKIDSLKLNEKNIDNRIELSKSTSNFNIPYSISSININNNKNINNVDINQGLKSFNIKNNYNNFYIYRKNDVLEPNKESKTQTQIESKKEINIYKSFNKNEPIKNSEIISKTKQKMKNSFNNNISNINNNGIAVSKIRNKSAKNALVHYNIYNINDFKNKNKLEDYKVYYDNLINNDFEGDDGYDEKNKNNFNINANSYNNMNKESLFNSINKKKKTYISYDYLNNFLAFVYY